MQQRSGALLVEYDYFPVQDEEASKKAGRPIYEDRVYVQIQIPGDKTSLVHRPAREADKLEYPLEWAAFQSGQKGAVVGTPLESWPPMTRGQVKELAALGIRSVEQLAGLSDANATGLIELRKRAKDYLAAAAGNAPVEAIRSELSKRENEIDMLRKQLKEQGDAIEKLRRGK